MNELYVLAHDGTAIACSSSQRILKEHVMREAKRIRARYEWETCWFTSPRLVEEVKCERAMLKIGGAHVRSYILYNIAHL